MPNIQVPPPAAPFKGSAESAPVWLRQDVLANLHLLQPDDLDAVVRMELVIPGRVTSSACYTVTTPKKKYVFFKERTAHVLRCPTIADFVTAHLAIAKKKPQFTLIARVALRRPEDERPAKKPAPAAPPLGESEPPEPVEVVDDPRLFNGESPEKRARREALNRQPEHYLQGRCKHHKLKVPLHHAKDLMVEALLALEFPNETAMPDGVTVAPESGAGLADDSVPVELPAGDGAHGGGGVVDPLEILDPGAPADAAEQLKTADTFPTLAEAGARRAYTQPELQAMPWDDLRQLGKDLGLPGKSRLELVGQVLEAQGALAPA